LPELELMLIFAAVLITNKIIYLWIIMKLFSS